jgi:putative heme-binding domain-containing protein
VKLGLLFLLLPQSDPRLPVPPPGWKVEIVAEAPRIEHPTVVCAAPDGRVFVGEDPMDMKPPARRPGGRVVCLHPDGRRTVFADGLYAPFGLLYLEGRLWVHHSPRLSVFRDEEGVGKDRVDLLECTNPEPWALDWNDHVPANLRLAMDGYLYMAVGDKGVWGAVGKDGTRPVLQGGGILRLRPDATGLEVYSSGTRNTLDVAINAEDELFTYDNTDEKNWMSRLTHMVEGGFYGYPWDFIPRRPYTLWAMADYGPGAATGSIAYAEDALPEEYRGNLFLSDFGKRKVLRVRVAREGATYRAVSREDFFSRVPDDFWPVGIGWTPDGLGFYLADWQLYDRKNVVVGRLYKATWTGKSSARPRPGWTAPAATGRPFEASTAELVGALSHPARDVRLVAQRRLADRGKEAVAPLVALLRDTGAAPLARAHAVWALDAIDGGVAGRAAILEAADDPAVRLQAARQLGTRRAKEASALFRRLLRDPDPALRFRAATALGRLGDPEAVPDLSAALEEKDLFARFAVFTALNRIGRADPRAWPAIARGLESPSEAVREGTVFAMRETCDEAVVSALAGRASMPAGTRARALEALAGICRKEPPWDGKWWNAYPGVSPYHPAASPRPERAVDWAGTRAALEALRAAPADPEPVVRRAGVEGLAEVRDRESAPRLREAFSREPDLGVRTSIVRALGVLKDAEAGELLAGLLGDGRSPEALRLEALGASERIGGEAGRRALLAGLAGAAGSKEVLLRALAAAPKLGGEAVAEAALAYLEDPDLAVRRAAIAAAGGLRSRKAVPALLSAFGREETRFEATQALGKIPDLRALDAYLYGLAHVNADLRWPSSRAIQSLGKAALSEVEKRLGSIPGPAVRELQHLFAAEKESPIHRVVVKKVDPEAYLEFALGNAGDAGRGRALFADPKGLACAKCHKAGGEGGDLGPDLSGVGSLYPRRELAESILYPSRKVREGYQQVIVRTKEGRILSGAVKAETPEELTLQDTEGNRHAIRKAEIDARKTSELSLMPEGVHAGLSMRDFADLVSYLESLKGAPPK